MTKQEIIESLKNTKVYVNGKSAEIQKKLFELGFVWCGYGVASVQFPDAPFLTITEKGIQWMNDMEIFTKHMVER